MKSISFITIFFLTTLHGFSGITDSLPTAKDVNLNRYIGKWYAIAALPQFFTRKCVAQTAEYEILNDEEVSVLNTCIRKKGKVRTIKGQAKVVNKNTNAELVVSFNNFFTRLFRVKGDYIIIKLDQDYQYVLVGTPDRKSLWLMSRQTTIPLEVKLNYLDLAKNLGFSVEKLRYSKF